MIFTARVNSMLTLVVRSVMPCRKKTRTVFMNVAALDDKPEYFSLFKSSAGRPDLNVQLNRNTGGQRLLFPMRMERLKFCRARLIKLSMGSSQPTQCRDTIIVGCKKWEVYKIAVFIQLLDTYVDISIGRLIRGQPDTKFGMSR
ncbi:hypothetical protein D9M71_680620 [compost metagenome]